MSIRTRILVGALGLAVATGLVGGAAAQTPTISHSTKTAPAKSANVHLVRHATHVHVAHRLSHKHVAMRHLGKRHLAKHVTGKHVVVKHVGAKQHLAKRIAPSHRA